MEDAKDHGELAELRFALEATAHGLQVAKPWGDNQRYDFITHHNGRMLRVQVKSCSTITGGMVKVNASCGGSKRRGRYSAEDVDFLAWFIQPYNAWYVVPVAEITATTLRLNSAKYEQYEDAWHLLKYDAD